MKTKTLIACLAALMACLALAGSASAAVLAGNTGWSWSNPLPQGNKLSVVETYGARAYAAGASGTLLRSDDGGATWTAARTGLLDEITRIDAISSDAVIFASRCALRRTDDGGASVHRLAWGPSDDTCVSPIQNFSFPTSNIGYLLLQNGDVFSTADGGDTWNKKTSAPGSTAAAGTQAVIDIAFTAANSGVLSVGNQIFHTDDGGTSWTPVKSAGTGAPGRYTFEFIGPMNGYAIGAFGPLLSTIDGGENWEAVAADGTTNSYAIASLTCSDLDHCLAVPENGASVLRTANAGASWSSVTPSSSAIFGAGFTSQLHAVAVGALGVTVVTDDGGATWSTINGGAAGNYLNLRATSASSAVITGESGGRLARTTDGGKSWRQLNASTSARVIDAAFPSANRGYVIDSAGLLLRTDNGGNSWRFLDTGTTAKPYAVYSPKDDVALLIGPRGVRRSDNAGADFASVGDRRFRRVALSNFDVAGSTVFAFSSRSIVLSKNGGVKWSSLKRPRGVKLIRDLEMISAKTGYLLDTKSELWFTKTAGKKWTRIETTGANYAYSLAFGDRLNGYLTDASGRVLYTADGGKTWSRQYPFFDAFGSSFSQIVAPAPKVAYSLVTGTNRVFATTTGGTIGVPSALTIKSSSKRVRKNTIVKVTGKLSPAAGGERVTVLARAIGAKGGTKWTSQERTVSAGGTFTTSWRVKKPTVFIARWSGDAAHDGDAASSVTVVIRKR